MNRVTGGDRYTYERGDRLSRWATAGEHLQVMQNRAGITAFMTGPKTATAYVEDEIHLFRFCRRGKARGPKWYLEAIRQNTGLLRFRSKAARRNYQIVFPQVHPVDHALMDVAFDLHSRNTQQFRAAYKSVELCQRGKALCARALWIMAHRDYDGDECLFLPNTKYGQPQKVRWNFQSMTAARAMLILTDRQPQSAAEMVTHKCGMGHMSCVNPKHMAWGSAKSNAEDRSLHNATDFSADDYGPNVIEAIKNDKRLSKVIAWDMRVPVALVTAAKTGLI